MNVFSTMPRSRLPRRRWSGRRTWSTLAAMAALLGIAAISRPGAAGADSPASDADHACRRCIEAHEDFLASDAMRGRGSGTHDELVAAIYIASELHAYGVEPAAADGTYIEIAPAPVRQRAAGARPPGRRGPAAGAAPPRRPTPPAVPATPYNSATAAGVGPALADAPASAPAVENGAGDSGAAPALPQPSPPLGTTANVVGVLRGADTSAPVLLLTAHLDHLGIRVPPDATAATDVIYNGASDDASGCTAVMEMARALAAGPRPKRTVYFALFGSEETGGAGARYFLEHPPVPLARMAANIEFEMISWPDDKVPAHTLWMTGWERSNLGPTLAAHGARLVGDPHPEQNFFMRSDNIQLARAGVVAQTISSYGLQPMYHRPDDDLAHMDFDLLTDGIDSLIAPIRWLANSDFVPAWNPGGRPGPANGPGGN